MELIDRERGDAHAADVGFGRHRTGKIDRRGGTCGQVARIGSAHDGGEERRIVDVARERAQRIECRRERHHTGQADHAVRRLESRQPAQPRGNADRAAGIRADRCGRKAGGDRDRGAAARAAGDAMCLRIPRVPRRAHRRVAAPGAVGEFDQMRLAQRNHARGEQMVGSACGLSGDTMRACQRSGGRYPAAEMHQILDRDRQPMQRSARRAGAAFAIGSRRRAQRVIAIHLDEGVQAAIERGDAVEIRRDDLARRSRAAHQQLRELGEGEPVQVVRHLYTRDVIDAELPSPQPSPRTWGRLRTRVPSG